MKQARRRFTRSQRTIHQGINGKTYLKTHHQDWTTGLKEKEASLKVNNLASASAESALKKDTKVASSPIKNTTAHKNRIKSSDYRAWDKLDIEAELEKLDQPDKPATSFVRAQKASNLSATPHVNSPVLMDIKTPAKNRSELEFLADLEKTKGNDCYKAGEYDDSVRF